MEWKLERISRFKIKTDDTIVWETIMKTFAKDFIRTKRHYPLKIGKTTGGTKTSYTRFKSRIVKKLRRGYPIASSPVTTGWQHSYTVDDDTVCQRLSLDLSPEGSSKSQLTLVDSEPTIIRQESTPQIEDNNVRESDNSLGKDPSKTTSTPLKKQDYLLNSCPEKKTDLEKTTRMCVNFIKGSSNSLGPFSIKTSPYRSSCALLELDLQLNISGLRNDYYLNLLDWNSANLIALALDSTTYIWNAETHMLEGSIHLKPGTSYISSVSWVEDGNFLAIGTSDGAVQIWDVERKKRLRNMTGHLSVVGALSWNNHILSSGSLLGLICHHDVRIAHHHVGTLRHRKGICSLKWSPGGAHLASGSTDGILSIWPNDPGVTVTQQPVQSMSHPTAVKAMAWCPWKTGVVAVGGGMKDGVLRIWETHTGNCIKSSPTDSQVCSLLWVPQTKEIVIGHGLPQNQISIWDFPSITKKAEMHAHNGRVLNLALSPCGSKIFSSGSDGMACIWRNRGSQEK
uniref:Cell division cycle 20B n=1 Tax=Lepisosteus oculatus TaxID=7918 RepID=W5M3M4_LEPOC|nr:PREDICTED: cell division cycle protein 20 homolog B isoform X2 [Lepisosteus oculatus]